MKIESDALNLCTSGFVAWNATLVRFRLWTAGHCGTHTWYLGSASGNLIGTTSSNYFADNSAADVQQIPINTDDRTNYYLDGTSNCNPCALDSVTISQGHDADQPGDAVCNHGYASGTKCGAIRSTNVTFTYLGVTLVRMRSASYVRNPGDSGGPLTAAADTAVGSHTHYQTISGIQYGIYSHVWEMESATGYKVYHGQNLPCNPVC